MRRRGCGAAVFFAGATLLAGAVTGVWQSKDFKDWTDQDAQTIIRESPWAKRIPMPAGGRPSVVTIEPGSNSAAPPSASMGNPSNTTSGTNMTSPAYPGSAGPADADETHRTPTARTPSGMTGPSGAPIQEPPLTIIWASAAPIRLAVLKLRSNGNTITDEQIARARRARDNYVIAVAGLPAPDGDFDPKTLAKNAFLMLKGKAPLEANESDYRKIGNSDVYFFRFIRTSLPIAIDDRQVEFKLTMGSLQLKKKFELKEMQFDGQLAL